MYILMLVFYCYVNWYIATTRKTRWVISDIYSALLNVIGFEEVIFSLEVFRAGLNSSLSDR